MIFGHVRSMPNGGNYIDSWRCILWAGVANAATLLENCIVKTDNEMNVFQQFWERRIKNNFIIIANIW